MIALDPPRWQAVSELYDGALELSTSERPAFLDRVCAAGSELRAALEALIAADALAGDFLERPAVAAGGLATATLETAVSRVGERIGAFRLVREIGRGGMGEVYLGEREDRQFEQRVAIKLIPAGPSSQRLLRDFLRERRILARLEHPHIARLLDGGVTADGFPYLVMEYVGGKAITAHCETKRLPLEDRLRLFLAVCEAVEAAHRAQVVHRDLKPSNILVDGQGNVKLLDFGVARIMDRESDATRTVLPQLTPLYAAPEQLRGEPATAATDVYALSLLLHELLTGTPAHRVRRATPEELVRAVLAEEPEPPSRAAARRQRELGTPAIPPRRLRGDLDRIVLEALQKEPGRRYPSAAALAGDLRRHLAGLPLTARAGGLAYRAAKLLRRRRREAATTTAALALAAGIVAWQGTGVPAARPLRFQLLSTFSGSHRSPSLAPDGKRFAFVQKDSGGVPQIWVKDFAGGDPVQLTHGGRPARRPRWSPLNDQIIYDVPGHGIWSLPLGGGTPRQILRQGFNANLSRDGRRIVYDTESAVGIAAVDGSGARRLTEESFSVCMNTPAFSPDGRWVVFFAAESGPYGDLWIVPSAGGEARRLTHDVFYGGDPVWTADGRWILYASDRGGAMNLWRVRAAGGTPEPVTEGAGEDTEPDLSADGRRLIYTSSRNTFALVWLDPRTGERRDLLERHTWVVHPSFSPRGDRVAFFAPLGPRSPLWTVGLHGEDLRQVTADPAGFEILPNWSGDGRTLFFYDLRRLFFGKVAASGGPLQVLAPGWKFERQHGAHVDPASRRVAYSVLRGSLTATTRIRDLASGRETRTAEPLRWPRWSPDGQSLAGEANDGRLLLCPASEGRCRTLSRAGALPRWTQGGREIYSIRYSGATETMPLFSVRPDGTGERQVAELSGFHPMHFSFDAAPGGEVVWTEWRPGQQQLWQAELPSN